MPLPPLTRTTEDDARFVRAPASLARIPARLPAAGEQYRGWRTAGEPA